LAVSRIGFMRRSSTCYASFREDSSRSRVMFEGLFQPMHLIVVLAIVLIVFGPGKLPEVGSALGEAIRNLKKALNEVSADSKPPQQQELSHDAAQKSDEQRPGTQA
jgi:sec-independent protein translocase protein TatA